MTGGLMNLTAVGTENIILNGNPKKTYFKATYNKHTNFGLQRFRIDFEGNRVLPLRSRLPMFVCTLLEHMTDQKNPYHNIDILIVL